MAHKTWYEQYWNILGVAGLGFAVRRAIQQGGGVGDGFGRLRRSRPSAKGTRRLADTLCFPQHQTIERRKKKHMCHILPKSYPLKLKLKLNLWICPLTHLEKRNVQRCRLTNNIPFHSVNSRGPSFSALFPWADWILKSKLLARRFRHHRWPVEYVCWQNKLEDHNNSIGLAKNKQNVQSTKRDAN